MNNKLKNEFLSIYKTSQESTFFAPGRVNLIGEHIDYNGGLVFPVALSIGTYGLIKKRDDYTIRAYSLNFKETGIVTLDMKNLHKEGKWTDYLAGVVDVLQKQRHNFKGFDILVYGNIPNGSGLSSSASLEVLVATSINNIFDLKLNKIEISKIAQKAENDFVLVNCGIMDQFAIVHGQVDEAMLLNTATLEYTYIPFNLKNYSLVICNTNKTRKLSDSKYNERREECEVALNILKNAVNISELCELNVEQLEKYKPLFENEIIYKRAKHAISENQRVLKAVEFLKENNLKEFGKLMNESHESLKVDYEVTGIELDTLVYLMQKNDCIGARMTGAGFGGCAICLVETKDVKSFEEKIKRSYSKIIGYAPDFYHVKIFMGAYKID